MTIVLVVLTLLNLVGAVINFRHARANVKAALEADATQAHADMLLQNAKQIAERARVDDEWIVCAECKRLVTRHDGVNCVNCATSLVKKA